MMSFMNFIKYNTEFKKFIKYFIFAFPPMITFYDRVGFVKKVTGRSMQPTLNPGIDHDWVLVNCWAARHHQFQRGEVVIFTSPKCPDDTFIKRVVGLEGDYVRKRGDSYERVRVPVGHCWVEGDNAKVSVDSHDFGPLPLGLVIGKASYIIWPLRRRQKLEVIPPDIQRVNVKLKIKFT